ncbi:MAG: putative transcriptional regulator [Candidatus Frackibacter sp. T328-2]|nr:MAG: putative transcriptional regulator [Candidatus Frackibacter sp. T328-2]
MKEELVKFLKILADETRLRIIELLSCGELCVCELQEELAMSQPRISHHLKLLKEAELVNTNRDGKWIYYSLNEKTFKLFTTIAQKSAELKKNYTQAEPSQRCREE